MGRGMLFPGPAKPAWFRRGRGELRLVCGDEYRRKRIYARFAFKRCDRQMGTCRAADVCAHASIDRPNRRRASVRSRAKAASGQSEPCLQRILSLDIVITIVICK